MNLRKEIQHIYLVGAAVIIGTKILLCSISKD